MTGTHSNRLLGMAGALSLLVAILHLAIAFMGARAYRYFGAGERMARLDERGSWWPLFVTLLLALVFALSAAYAFSGARLIGRVPLLKTGLVAIGSFYALRGLALIPQAALLLWTSGATIPPRHLLFSAVSLTIGLSYLVGTRRAWPEL